MTKRKGLILCLVVAALMLLAGAAVASEVDPIVCSMELDPNKLAAPGTVNVTITISNSGNTDMKDPVVLYDPAAQIVSDFGTNGAVLLKAGESATWTGTYDVNDRTLENGAVVYFVKYTLYKDSGEAVDQSQPIRAAISLQTAETDMDVKRTISPTVAGEGQEVVVRYDITNSGTVSLTDVTIEENQDIHKEKQTIPLLEPGKTAEVRYTVTMGKEDLTSGATITYKSEAETETQTYTVENQTITYGEASLTANLTSNVKGVVENGTVTLTLELKNTGNVDYSDLRVTDPSLGDVFTNQQLKAGESLTLEKMARDAWGLPLNVQPFVVDEILTPDIHTANWGGLLWHLHQVPGHSPDSIVYDLPDEGIMFTGDVIFAGSIGRTDLPGGNLRLLKQGIEKKVLNQPATTMIFPGHGPYTNVKNELLTNPFIS